MTESSLREDPREVSVSCDRLLADEWKKPLELDRQTDLDRLPLAMQT